MGVDPAAMMTRPSLLIRLRDGGDADAWRTFVTIYAPLVQRFGRRHGLQEADAADLTQDVLGEVCRVMRRFEYRPERGRFRDWLLVITRRQFVRFQKRRARSPEKLAGESGLAGVEDDRLEAEWNDAFHSRVLRVASSVFSRRLTRIPGELLNAFGWRTVRRLRRPMTCHWASTLSIPPSRGF